MRERMKPEDRRDDILGVALTVAEKYGYNHMSREQIAKEAMCSAGLVTHYWKSMILLRRAVMRRAVRDGNVTVLAQGIGAGDPNAKKAAPEHKKKAIALLAA